jgi:hypothetical protein
MDKISQPGKISFLARKQFAAEAARVPGHLKVMLQVEKQTLEARVHIADPVAKQDQNPHRLALPARGFIA